MYGVSPFHHIYHHNKLKERYQYLERIPVTQSREIAKKTQSSHRRHRTMLRLGSPSTLDANLKVLLPSHVGVTDPLPDGSKAGDFCLHLISCYWSEFRKS